VLAVRRLTVVRSRSLFNCVGTDRSRLFIHSS